MRTRGLSGSPIHADAVRAVATAKSSSSILTRLPGLRTAVARPHPNFGAPGRTTAPAISCDAPRMALVSSLDQRAARFTRIDRLFAGSKEDTSAIRGASQEIA